MFGPILIAALSVFYVGFGESLDFSEQEPPNHLNVATFKKSLFDGDKFEVPEWLQNVPERSKIPKYRKRRFELNGTALVVS